MELQTRFESPYTDKPILARRQYHIVFVGFLGSAEHSASQRRHWVLQQPSFHHCLQTEYVDIARPFCHQQLTRLLVCRKGDVHHRVQEPNLHFRLDNVTTTTRHVHVDLIIGGSRRKESARGSPHRHDQPLGVPSVRSKKLCVSTFVQLRGVVVRSSEEHGRVRRVRYHADGRQVRANLIDLDASRCMVDLQVPIHCRECDIFPITGQ
mmetsp:Transcript_34132/g.77917  ORF Transcript_34132/g.77917 Transcript_34132/m.77917 type:complete len:208 (+) Transcript_34132:208-831(+)